MVTQQFTPPPGVVPGGPGKRSKRGWIIAAVIVGVLLIGATAVQLLRPVPEPQLRLTTAATRTVPGARPVLTWPVDGQAAVEVEGVGRMGGSGTVIATPTASVAKVMTAYVFLKAHPLAGGRPGPAYTISPEEAGRLQWRKDRDESLVDVKPNQQFTEREALQALLLVSANNIAHEMARWDAGGDAQFAAKMNAAARELGMTHSNYTDPSGFDATTVSTADDQVKLMRAAMRLPAFAEAMNTRVYTPSDGSPPRNGGNSLLGIDGVVGGKTGFTSRAGGNFVFAARSHGRLIIGAVMAQLGASSAADAIGAARPLLESAENALTKVTIARPGKPVAELDDGFGHRTPMAGSVTTVAWPGAKVHLTATDENTITVSGQRNTVRPMGAVRGPSILDKLIRLR